MSKKMMKRSLALGALMAFVITGSAMAKEVTFDNKVYLHNDHEPSITYYDFLEVIKGDDVTKITINNLAGSGITAHYHNEDGTTDLKDSTVYVNINKPKSDLVINSGLYGINFSNKSTINVKDLFIYADGNAIVADGRLGATITADNILLDAGQRGILVQDSNDNNPQLTVNVNTSLTIDSDDHGLRVGNGVLDINAEKASVKITSTNGSAIKVGTGSVDVDANSFTANGDIIVEKTGSIIVDGGTSTTITGDVKATGAGTINVSGDSVVINGSVRAYAQEGGETINIKGTNIKIDAGYERSAVVAWDSYAPDGNDKVINLGEKGKTQSIYIKGADGLFSQYVDNKINVYGTKLEIDAADIGIYAGNESNYYKDPAAVSVYTDNTIIKGQKGIEAFSHSVVNIENGLVINAEKAIVTRGDAKINIKGNGDVKIDGDIVFNNTGTDENPNYNADEFHTGVNASVNINLATKNSKFEGMVFASDRNGTKNDELAQYVKGNGTTGMVLGLSNGATWTVTGDSFVNDIYGSKGTIELTVVEENNGTRLAKVNILGNNSNADLTIKQAEVTADDVAVKEQQKHLNDLAEAITAETSNYTLVIEEGAVVGAVTATVDADGKAGKAVEAVNTVNKSIGEAAAVGIAHFRAHMNDMNKRMGELRMANGEAGVWTRMVRGEEEFAGAKSQYNQYQLGYDEKLSVDKRWTVGAAVTFAEGSGNFTNGSIENDSTAFAIYGSKLNNDGTFVDLIGRYAKFDNDVTMSGEKADYSTNGMSVSAEFGKRIQQGNGLWIEPQVELTYGTVDSAEYTIAGRNVQVGDMDSLIGRVGFSLGKDIKEGNVYARASYLYDFDGETETTFGKGDVTRTIAEDLGGGWWEVGVGANINLSKATYIYADVEKTFGGEVDTNWKWNLGVRYSF